MEFSFTKKKNSHLYLTYSLAFLIVAFFVYGTYLITGHALIWHLDGANQHLPLLEEYRRYLHAFFKDPSTINTWSWHFGLGSDVFQVYSYYTLGDIFIYPLLLLPAKALVTGYQVMIVIRLYCAGLAFCYFANHFEFDRFTITGGALVYLFNAFLLYSNVAQPFFTTPFILFPLIIVALERTLQQGKIGPLILVFSWMLISSFYFAYILGIGAMLYLGLRFGLTYRKKIKTLKARIQLLSKLALATVISLLCSSFLLVPEIIAVKNSTRSGGVFANGLNVYPLYYYLALPSQLINGANRDFYFWSALGFSSIVFFALIYIILQKKTYRLTFWALCLSFIMLLLPQFGALMNGLMAPSNRWTLLSCLPIAFAVCVLLKDLRSLSEKTLQIFSFSLVGYMTFIGLTYLFQNDEKLFVPMIFLFVFWALLGNANKKKTTQKFLLSAILLNVCLNAIYFEAPFNGGYAAEMLPLKAYETLKTKRFAGLEKNLPDPKDDFYRISTLSKNYNLGSNYHLYNVLGSKLYSINSYYSLQNKALSDFANAYQNAQYEANIPLGQLSDRTILNNFLGVRYLFTQINQPNATKIPYGYQLVQTTPKISDANGDSSKDRQTKLYQTRSAFPLVYFQTKVLPTTEAKKLSATEQERALPLGVVVSQVDATGLAKVDQKQLRSEVQELPYQLISSRGNVVSPNELDKQDSEQTYTLVLQLPKEQTISGELQLDLSHIKYVPYTLKKQLALEEQQKVSDLTQGLLEQNKLLTSYKYFRYHILQGSPDNSFSLSVSSPLGSEKLFQPKQNALSFYKVVTAGTLNLGYFETLPQTLTLTPSKLGNYHFDLKVYVQTLGPTYVKQVKELQKHALQQVKLTPTGLSGQIKVDQAGILTSSIPYAKGWSVKVDGKKRPVLKTNHAFVGVRLTKGKHQIRFSYTIPGLKLGAYLSLSGLICLGFCLIFEKYYFRRSGQ